MDLPFRLLNVFSIEGDPFSGNPLAVLTDAGGLSDAEMQSWARQFNLSETAFVTSHDGAGRASARIFTPGHEMPFAGHPTLGTAAVIASLASAPLDEVTLTVPAGDIPVTRLGAGWSLTAPVATTRAVTSSQADLAAGLGVDPHVVVRSDALWVGAGVEQLIVRVDSVAGVRACRPDAVAMAEHMTSPGRPPHVYVWAWTGPRSIEARLFYTQDGAVHEDPATGSACANLGAWLVHQGSRDVSVDVSQGTAVGRPSVLLLEIDPEGTVHVGGRVEHVGSGTCVARDVPVSDGTGA
ncbi:PhzF family phenazine biosynthesis protein [Humibacillus xanthopallidus]|uniref:PhzF family phenazine biosynthesis protein n=1 Tax=Humibacillus xanthopallidus TaxID=412689 RepID=A0A543HIE5_9MICO|nr:PhzF family phenazine biosynthesis protein [Humibacillus xanthopallidus]TQM58077.1 PhzF family phenazine biosynthesis protein [Humibacillus xanthopallidus]